MIIINSKTGGNYGILEKVGVDMGIADVVQCRYISGPYEWNEQDLPSRGAGSNIRTKS